MQFWLSVIIFLIAYTLIVVEKVHRTIVALIGATVVVALGIITQKQAFASIDFNTIGLLIGMMIIVGITRQSGVFEYLAIKSSKLAGGKPLAILVVLSVITALISALLDNVTTVLLIVPITFAITDRLDISPMPFMFAEIMSSNIGGTATLIGDPPNIMIGSATGLGFVDFITNLAVPVMIILFVTIGIMLWLYRKQLKATPDRVADILKLDEKSFIKDWHLMKQSIIVLGLTVMGFILHQQLHLESATIALLGAGLLMLISSENVDEVLLTVEWPVIFFFAGLFVMVEGLVKTGVITLIAEKFLAITGGKLVSTGILVLWFSAIASAFVDNIPFVATMIPLLQSVGQLSHMPMESVWWALALGACLGGNGTLIGASANIIVAGIAERYNNPIRFVEFFKVGFPLMLISIFLAMIYLYLFYWL
ncbi:MAG TPA: ArsB/NhaD family transporter [Syntrophomonadaceae bacterium]|nr:ArsB/NhaD family transporter [Syntrophomonadaceae bacterium]